MPKRTKGKNSKKAKSTDESLFDQLFYHDKTIGVLLTVGIVSHLINFQLESITLRDNTWFWVLFLVPSLLGTGMFFFKLELHKNASWENVAGLKLQGVKLISAILIFITSAVMFGGVGDTILLSANYLLRDKQVTSNQYRVKTASAVRPGHTKRSEKRVVELTVEAEGLKDVVELSDLEYRHYDESTAYVTINAQTGLFGWGIVSSVEL